MALFRMAVFRLFALIFRHFAWRISFFCLFAWRYFVFSLFRLKNEMAQTSHHTKRLHLVTARLSKHPRNQVIGVLKVGSTVNDIAHHLGCSRQTIHDLMNRYNSTASVRVRARPGRARVTTLRLYRVTR